MNVSELKELLDKVVDTSAEVRVGVEDDNFFDGQTVTGIMIMHNMVDETDAARVFIVGDATQTKN